MFSAAFPLVIFLVNFIPALSFFRFPALQPSVEPTVWVQTRFIVDNWPNLSWFGNWYLGYPFRFSGPPVFVYLLAILDKITGISIPTLEGIILSLSLGILAVGVYFLARFLIKNNLIAAISALIFTILPSAGYVFPQAAQIGANFSFLPWRIAGFLTFGGGATLAGLAILPFLILLFWQTINQFSRKNFVLTAVLTTFLLLTDFSIFVSFVIFMIAILATEGMTPLRPTPSSASRDSAGQEGGWLLKTQRTVAIILVAFGLATFWYTPSYFWQIITSPSLLGMPAGLVFRRIAEFALVALPTFLAVFGFFGKKLAKESNFVILSFGFFGFLTLLWWATDPDFLTLYSRFFTEIDITAALAIGLLYQKLNIKLQKYIVNFKNMKNLNFYFVILLFAIYFLLFGWRVFNPNLPKTNLRVEREIAEWLQSNVSPTDRVFLSGSTAFWLNWFAPNLSQIRGGVDQAASNPFWAHASFNLREGEDPATALAWTKALRVEYVVVHDADSREFYHDFKNPEKFSQIGQKVYDNGAGDKIYQISTPGVTTVTERHILKVPKPKNGADLGNLKNYAEILEKGRRAEVSWISSSKLKIKASNLTADEGISLGITYDPGWQVQCKIQNAKCKIRKDSIGNIFVDVQERVLNMQEIELTHGPRFDNWVGVLISLATIGGIIFWPKIGKKITPHLPKLPLETEDEY